jgi:hypothetical protein
VDTPKDSEDPTFPVHFFATSEPGYNGCLNWTGKLNPGGRGCLKFDGRLTTAQRVAWRLAYGPVPEGMFVAHKCHNRRCIRVTHLELMTAEELNARRRAFTLARSQRNQEV